MSHPDEITYPPTSKLVLAQLFESQAGFMAVPFMIRDGDSEREVMFLYDDSRNRDDGTRAVSGTIDGESATIVVAADRTQAAWLYFGKALLSPIYTCARVRL